MTRLTRLIGRINLIRLPPLALVAAAAADLTPATTPNVPLGPDPPALPANWRAQAEPHLARSPLDPSLLLAVFQEGRYADGGAVTCGYALSLDGGTRWRRALIPNLVASIDGGPFVRASDPVAAIDARGLLYLNTLGIQGRSPNFQTTIVLHRSRDLGLTWDGPLTVVTNTNPDLFLDKNWLTVNAFPDTPTAGRVVATYTLFDSTDAQRTPIVALYSDDEGDTWSAPQVMSPPDCQGSQPVFLPDGALAVVYWNFSGALGNQIEVAVSPDGGTTWEPPRLVTRVPLWSDPVARSGSFLPAAAADRQLGLLWVAYQAAVGVPRILVTRSRDQGRTWTPPQAINDTPGGRSVFNPAIAVSADGQHVTVVFYDKRHDAGNGTRVDLYLAESLDGGATWQPNRRITDVSSDLTLAPLTPSGRMFGDYQGIVPALDLTSPAVAIWIDTRSGSPDPYVASIARSQGTRFEAWRMLAFSPEQLASPTVSSPDRDPDLDGLPNLVEYGLGTDPARATAVVPAVHASGSTVTLSVAYSALAAGDLTWDWLASEDLRAWTPATPAEVIETVPAAGRLLLQATFPEQGEPGRYYRLGARLKDGE